MASHKGVVDLVKFLDLKDKRSVDVDKSKKTYRKFMKRST